MKKIATVFISLFFSLNCFAAHHEDAINLEQFSKLQGWDLDATQISSQKLNDNLYVLFGVGGNIAVSIGNDGVLIVDDQFPAMMPKIKQEIRNLGGGEITYVINTHWHFDHAEGNNAIDPSVTQIVAHSNARAGMRAGGIIDLVSTKYLQQPYPANALPVITHEKGMTLYFNDEIIDLVHYGSAHTSGDSAVLFRKQNAVHFGDIFVTEGYPFIDVSSGGSIDGMITFLENTINQLEPGAIVIPGHGQISTIEDVQATIEMLKTVRGRISKMIKDGKTLGEVIEARPTKDYDEKYPDWLGNFVNRVYTSLKKEQIL